ncbi:hypothetical protein ACFPMF_15185 [Larkinella bovis]|uniref:Uncharacterized protein n=1 Tax=Larkinella bovis TaxID=683041 RepID=A0ABW0IB02_9BACT
MNGFKKNEIEKWLLGHENSFGYYKWLEKTGQFEERDEVNLNALEKLKLPAQVLLKYKEKIESEFGITINIVDFWNKYYADLNITDPETKEKFKEESIIKQIIKYATEEKEKFEKAANSIRPEKEKSEQIEIATYERYFSKKEYYDFTINALKQFSIINEQGEYMLQNRKEGIVSGFIDALIMNDIFPKQSDKSAHETFCKILRIEYKRFKRESKQYDEMKKKVDKYCKDYKKHLQTQTD